MSSTRPLVIGPVGRGGVASVIAAVRPHLGDVRVLASGGGVGRSPARWLAAWRAGRRASVVHLHSSLRPRALPRDLLLASALRAESRPVVLDLHGTSPALRDALAGPLAGALRRFAVGGVLRSVDPAVVARLRALAVDVSLARVAVDLAALPTERRPEPGLVLFVGRLVEGKGLRELLAAAAGWSAPRRLVVVGDGPLAPEVRRAGPGVEAVGWAGPEARAAWLARAAVLVLPSAGEGAPLAVAEAVASGVPVVASGGAGVRALVGRAGLVLDRASAAAIDAAVDQVLADPPSTDDDRARVRRECDPVSVAAEWRSAWAEAESRARRAG